jgi:hypothetical protein
MTTDPHTELWLTLLSLLSDDELIRFQKRASMKLESPEGYNLMQALSDELIRRDLMKEVIVPPLKR